ncbi:MAG: hypothetical protein ABSH40_17650 [Bryobacteraceae bacterium]
MIQAADPRSLTCDGSGIRWERTGPAPALQDAPRNARASAVFFNRGQKTWPLIARNKPVAAGTYWASASPVDGSPSPGSTPLKQEFCVKAKNQYGISVVAIGYQFLVQTGGRSEASDRYVTRIEIAPNQVELAWGWNVEMTVVMQNPGEYGEPGAPFAVLPAQLELTVATELKSLRVTQMHMVFPQGVLLV